MTTAATATMPGSVGQHGEVAAEPVPKGRPVPCEPLVHVLIPMTHAVMSAEMHHQQAENYQYHGNQHHAAHQTDGRRDRRVQVFPIPPGVDVRAFGAPGLVLAGPGWVPGHLVRVRQRPRRPPGLASHARRVCQPTKRRPCRPMS